jgi:two-component system sensor histidine kinase KdpD
MSLRSEVDPARTEQSLLRRWITPVTVSLVFVGMTTAALWAAEAHLQQDHLIFIYLVPTALIAIRYGSISAMGVTIASSLAASYFLYAPRFSFEIANPLDMMELVLFCLLALLASQVVSGFAHDGDVRTRIVPMSGGWFAALRSRFRHTPS